MLTLRGLCRLGHKVQKDEWIPRLVEVFQRGNIIPPNAVVAAGSAYSAATAGNSECQQDQLKKSILSGPSNVSNARAHVQLSC